jgi:hypothetical protein
MYGLGVWREGGGQGQSRRRRRRRWKRRNILGEFAPSHIGLVQRLAYGSGVRCNVTCDV